MKPVSQLWFVVWLAVCLIGALRLAAIDPIGLLIVSGLALSAVWAVRRAP